MHDVARELISDLSRPFALFLIAYASWGQHGSERPKLPSADSRSTTATLCISSSPRCFSVPAYS